MDQPSMPVCTGAARYEAETAGDCVKALKPCAATSMHDFCTPFAMKIAHWKVPADT
jgi:hypothetical protein